MLLLTEPNRPTLHLNRAAAASASAGHLGLTELLPRIVRWDLPTRWHAVCSAAVLARTDAVLDVGCGDGSIALEAARVVHHVHALDCDPAVLHRARRAAEARGVENVRFQLADITATHIAPLSYDVIFMLGVWDEMPDSKRSATLHMLLQAARRQLVIQTPLTWPAQPLLARQFVSACSDADFVLKWSGRASAKGGGDVLVVTRKVNRAA
jgi:SAM-dependent methyltransferase